MKKSKVSTINPKRNLWAEQNESELFLPEFTPPLFTPEQCLQEPNKVIEIRNEWTQNYFKYLRTLKGYTQDKPCNVLKPSFEENQKLSITDSYGANIQDILPTITIRHDPKLRQNKVADLFKNEIRLNRLSLEVPYNGIIGLGHEFGHFLDPQGLVIQAENEFNAEIFPQMMPGLDRLLFANDKLLKPRLEMERRAWDYAYPLFDFWALPENEIKYISDTSINTYFSYFQPQAVASEVYEAQKFGNPIDLNTPITIFADNQLNTHRVSIGNIVETFTETYTKMGIPDLATALSL